MIHAMTWIIWTGTKVRGENIEHSVNSSWEQTESPDSLQPVCMPQCFL